jgi:maleate isomerase
LYAGSTLTESNGDATVRWATGWAMGEAGAMAEHGGRTDTGYWHAHDWKRIGMLTPSSNSVLEPVTSRMLAAFGDTVTAHFGRFRVTEISMGQASQSQFDSAPILAAADLLADAKVDVIAWNGTSASWLGFERDEALCREITAATGIPATSTILALNEALRLLRVRRLALVTPYLSEIQERIIANYAAGGIEVVADRRLEDRGNFSFACYTAGHVARLMRETAAVRPDAIAVVCTNFRGTDFIAEIERETGVMVLDSIAVTLWGTLRACGVSPARVTGSGCLFREVA